MASPGYKLSNSKECARELSRELGTKRPPLLAQFVETVFFGSLLREEGETISFNIVYPGTLDSGAPVLTEEAGTKDWHVIDFQRPQPFDPPTLAKHAILASGHGEHLVVHCIQGQLFITGVASEPEYHWFAKDFLTARVPRPGEIHFLKSFVEVLQYAGGVVSRPVRWPFSRSLPAASQAIYALRDRISVASAEDLFSAALQRIAIELIQRQHGGLFVVVAAEDAVALGQALKTPLQYGAALASSWEISGPLSQQEDPSDEDVLEEKRAQALVDRCLSLIGRMTMTDGAVLATPALDVVGFRTRLHTGCPPDAPPPTVFRVIDAHSCREMDMSQKGTRHQSAAAFVSGDSHRIALVASADGPAAAMFQDEAGSVLYWPLQENYAPFDF